MRPRGEVAPASCRRCWSSMKKQGAGGTPALLKPSLRRIGTSGKLMSHYRARAVLLRCTHRSDRGAKAAGWVFSMYPSDLYERTGRGVLPLSVRLLKMEEWMPLPICYV